MRAPLLFVRVLLPAGLCLSTAAHAQQEKPLENVAKADGTPRAIATGDRDHSTGVGTLGIFDFLCFQNSFVAAEPYACDCDTSTGPAVCDVFDFLCFQNAFVAGCP